ncbi:MAG: hypothetical protein IH602_10345 [Bryobacteraceae bacterium]|nr:hypothetical protein [Bryobacteraceae bacterium]
MTTSKSLGLAGLALILILAGPAARGQAFSFGGEVRAGESYSRPLKDELKFCLLPSPDSSGWTISISDSCAPDAPNFAMIATPPYRGPNPIYVDAWHFLPDARVFSATRSFRFVLNRRDHAHLFGLLSARKDAAEILAEAERLGKGVGEVTVAESVLAPGTDPKQPRLLRLRFKAAIKLPARAGSL